jgi:hypothetical protein
MTQHTVTIPRSVAVDLLLLMNRRRRKRGSKARTITKYDTAEASLQAAIKDNKRSIQSQQEQ